MKYDKMLCWVRPHEKRELKEAVNNQFSLEFAKNYEDFKRKITDHSYLVFSMVKAIKNLSKLQCLLRNFPNNTFNLYARDDENDEPMTDEEMTLFEEPNITLKQWTANDLVQECIMREV